MDDDPVAIFLSGPIGVGKSTLGRALANAVGGHFLEGDDHAPTDAPWYAFTLTTHRSIRREVIDRAGKRSPVVIAYPLRCIEWIFYRRPLREAGIRPVFVSLHATFDNITAAHRQRSFNEEERSRIGQMVEQGYGRRAFSDFIIGTAEQDVSATVKILVQKLQESGSA